MKKYLFKKYRHSEVNIASPQTSFEVLSSRDERTLKDVCGEAFVNIVNLEFRCQRTFSKVTVPDYDKNIKKVIRALELRLRKIITS